jgi:dTDP-4-dehydrorhamnose reductase
MMGEFPTVLITGGDGQLATALRPTFADAYRVVAVGKSDMDVADPKVVTTYIDSLQPKLVLHTAAFTDVDACEEDKPLAYQVNTVGSENVASACARAKVPLIAFSTDYVFDGQKGSPYTEADEPDPLNTYGRSKLEGERRILTIHRDATIVRTGWLYSNTGRNFVLSILSQCDRKPEHLTVVDDQVGSPTWVGNLAAQVRALADHPIRGVVHATSQGEISWCGFTRALLDQLQSDIPVKAITTAELGRPAKRPANSALDNSRLREAGVDVMPTWQAGLVSFVNQYRAAGVAK